MIKYVFAIFILVWGQVVFSHGGAEHSANENKITDTGKSLDAELIGVYKEVNESYLKSIKPIFQRKCLDCHGSGNKKPWYYVIPGPRQLMDYDIEEAKEHMDMSDDFPFKGHGDVKEDLEELKEVVEDNSMPPWQYKLIHWSSGLTQEDKKTIIKWVNESLLKINQGEAK